MARHRKNGHKTTRIGMVSEMLRLDFLSAKHQYPERLSQTNYLAGRTDVTVYRFENLQDVARELSKRFELPMLAPKSKAGLWFGDYDWRSMLDAEAISMINELCDDDFKQFGYKKWIA